MRLSEIIITMPVFGETVISLSLTPTNGQTKLIGETCIDQNDIANLKNIAERLRAQIAINAR